MTSVLVTAFEPYGVWPQNASWLTLMELTRELPQAPRIVTRRYPVDFAEVRRRMAEDLAANYDFALHLGQAPSSARIRLETVALNLGTLTGNGATHPLCDDGPVAYRSSLPAELWSDQLRSANIPAQVSYHAGTYLCNAALYWSHYYAEHLALQTRSLFVHLPLETSQVAAANSDTPSLPARTCAQAVRMILEAMAALE
jgi:pyroglutamyl-peptidase